MNRPEGPGEDNDDVQELDLAKEFESFAARIRNCLFGYNTIQLKELNLFLQSSTILISYGVRSFKRIPSEFVKEYGAPLLHADSPAALSEKLYTSLSRANFRLHENQSNYGDIVTLALIFDVLVRFRRK